MSLIPQLSNPYLGALIGGLTYGLAVCTATCLPYVASYIAGTGANFRKGVGITLTFNSGRIIAYALIGGLVGLFRKIDIELGLAVFQVAGCPACSFASG